MGNHNVSAIIIATMIGVAAVGCSVPRLGVLIGWTAVIPILVPSLSPSFPPYLPLYVSLSLPLILSLINLPLPPSLPPHPRLDVDFIQAHSLEPRPQILDPRP